MKLAEFKELLDKSLKGEDESLDKFASLVKKEISRQCLEWFKKRADEELRTENSYVFVVLGYAHNLGWLEDQIDHAAAIKFHELAIKKDNVRGMCARAYMYLHGEGEPDNQPNYPEAIKLYERGIEKNCVHAIFNRAVMYGTGQGEPDNQPNYLKAIELYERGIQKGDPDSMCNRAYMHEKGLGEPNEQPNYAEAIKLYEEAIKHNCVTAMFNRALMYEKGLGEPDSKPNYPKAFEFHKKADGRDVKTDLSVNSTNRVSRKKLNIQGITEKDSELRKVELRRRAEQRRAKEKSKENEESKRCNEIFNLNLLQEVRDILVLEGILEILHKKLESCVLPQSGSWYSFFFGARSSNVSSLKQETQELGDILKELNKLAEKAKPYLEVSNQTGKRWGVDFGFEKAKIMTKFNHWSTRYETSFKGIPEVSKAVAQAKQDISNIWIEKKSEAKIEIVSEKGSDLTYS